MATIAEFKRRFDRFQSSLSSTVSDTVAKTADVIVDLNRDQLLYGRNAKGEVLSPSILDDPYWNDKGGREAAARYVKDKNSRHGEFAALMSYTQVQLFPGKNDASANLIHSTGSYFFNHFFINASENSYVIGSTGIAADDIEDKYDSVYGLAPQSKGFYWRGWIGPAVWQSLINNLNNK